MTNADYVYDLMFLANTPAQSKSLLHSLVQASGDFGLYVNANKTVIMCFKRGNHKKLVEQFTHLGSNISSTDSDVNT